MSYLMSYFSDTIPIWQNAYKIHRIIRAKRRIYLRCVSRLWCIMVLIYANQNVGASVVWFTMELYLRQPDLILSRGRTTFEVYILKDSRIYICRNRLNHLYFFLLLLLFFFFKIARHSRPLFFLNVQNYANLE